MKDSDDAPQELHTRIFSRREFDTNYFWFSPSRDCVIRLLFAFFAAFVMLHTPKALAAAAGSDSANEFKFFNKHFKIAYRFCCIARKAPRARPQTYNSCGLPCPTVAALKHSRLSAARLMPRRRLGLQPLFCQGDDSTAATRDVASTQEARHGSAENLHEDALTSSSNQDLRSQKKLRLGGMLVMGSGLTAAVAVLLGVPPCCVPRTLAQIVPSVAALAGSACYFLPPELFGTNLVEDSTVDDSQPSELDPHHPGESTLLSKEDDE